MTTDESKTVEIANGRGYAPADGSVPAPFGVLILTNLRIRLFSNKDDLQTAIRILETNGTRFVPLVYHNGAKTYIVPETHT